MDTQGPLVTLYTKPDCHLCEQARAELEEVRRELPFALVERDITLDEELHRAYFERIPVVCLDGEELFEYFVDAEALRERLGGWRRRPKVAEPGSSTNVLEGGAGGRRSPSRAPRPMS